MPQSLGDLLGGTITQTKPDDFGRVAVQKTSLVKIVVLGHDGEFLVFREFPDGCVVGALQVKLSHMRGRRKNIGEIRDQSGRRVLVGHQPDAGMLIRRRSRSAANARQARISPAVRSGKSVRICVSVMPEAR